MLQPFKSRFMLILHAPQHDHQVLTFFFSVGPPGCRLQVIRLQKRATDTMGGSKVSSDARVDHSPSSENQIRAHRKRPLKGPSDLHLELWVQSQIISVERARLIHRSTARNRRSLLLMHLKSLSRTLHRKINRGILIMAIS